MSYHQYDSLIRRLEKSKKVIFSLIERLSQAKASIQHDKDLNPFQRIEAKTQIETLLIELNNESFNFSDDIIKCKKGHNVSIDKKSVQQIVK